MGAFYQQVELGIDQMIGDIDVCLRRFYLDLFGMIIMRSPVGNPRNWKINAQKLKNRKAIAKANRVLRTRAENLGASGRLKPGRKLHASAAKYNQNTTSSRGPVKPGSRKLKRGGDELFSPKGYIGGRFRANWQFTLDAPSMAVIEAVDPDGETAMGALRAVLNTMHVSTSKTAHFVNNLPYAMAIEFGVDGKSPLYPIWSKQAPRGVVRVSLAEAQQLFNRAFK